MSKNIHIFTVRHGEPDKTKGVLDPSLSDSGRKRLIDEAAQGVPELITEHVLGHKEPVAEAARIARNHINSALGLGDGSYTSGQDMAKILGEDDAQRLQREASSIMDKEMARLSPQWHAAIQNLGGLGIKIAVIASGKQRTRETADILSGILDEHGVLLPAGSGAPYAVSHELTSSAGDSYNTSAESLSAMVGAIVRSAHPQLLPVIEEANGLFIVGHEPLIQATNELVTGHKFPEVDYGAIHPYETPRAEVLHHLGS